MVKFIPSFDIAIQRTENRLEQDILVKLKDTLNDDFEVYYKPPMNGDFPEIVVITYPDLVYFIKPIYGKIYEVDKNYFKIENLSYNTLQKTILIDNPIKSVNRYKFNLLKYSNTSNFLSRIRILSNRFKNISAPISPMKHIGCCIVGDSDLEPQDILNSDSRDKDYTEFFSSNDLDSLIKCINELSIQNLAFSTTYSEISEMFDEFKPLFRISYNNEYYQSNFYIEKEYQPLTQPKYPEYINFTGPAGSGKTVFLIYKALFAISTENKEVLILYFNIAMKNYLDQLISSISKNLFFSNLNLMLINNYFTFHRFIFSLVEGFYNQIHWKEYFKELVNKKVIDINKAIKNANYTMEEDETLDEVFNNIELDPDSKVDIIIAYIKDNPYIIEKKKFKTILIDEVQDLKSSWIEFIKEYILDSSGSLSTFGDYNQDIYKKDNTKKQLNGVMFTKNTVRRYQNKNILDLLKLYNAFYFNNSKDIISDDFISYTSPVAIATLDYDNEILQHICVYQLIEVLLYVKNKLNYNDITVLCSQIDILRELEYELGNDFKVITTFENKEQYNTLKTAIFSKEELVGTRKMEKWKERRFQEELDNLRGTFKNNFRINSGSIKLSTIHSFKGLDSHAVILVILPGVFDKELIYVGLTRAREYLYIISYNSSFNAFIKSNKSMFNNVKCFIDKTKEVKNSVEFV